MNNELSADTQIQLRRTRLERLKTALLPAGTKYRKVWFGLAAGYRLPLPYDAGLRIAFGMYETPLKRPIRRLCEDARTCYEIGSAIGYYAIAFLNLAVDDCRVYAFEANQGLCEGLDRTLRENEVEARIRVIPAKIGATDADGNITIDSCVEKYGLQLPDFVKIDIEGGELEALIGMTGTIERARPAFVIEVHSLELEDLCREYLSQRGYLTETVDFSLFQKRLFPERRPLVHNRWLVAESRNPDGRGYRSAMKS